MQLRTLIIPIVSLFVLVGCGSAQAHTTNSQAASPQKDTSASLEVVHTDDQIGGQSFDPQNIMKDYQVMFNPQITIHNKNIFVTWGARDSNGDDFLFSSVESNGKWTVTDKKITKLGNMVDWTHSYVSGNTYYNVNPYELSGQQPSIWAATWDDTGTLTSSRDIYQGSLFGYYPVLSDDGSGGMMIRTSSASTEYKFINSSNTVSINDSLNVIEGGIDDQYRPSVLDMKNKKLYFGSGRVQELDLNTGKPVFDAHGQNKFLSSGGTSTTLGMVTTAAIDSSGNPYFVFEDTASAITIVGAKPSLTPFVSYTGRFTNPFTTTFCNIEGDNHLNVYSVTTYQDQPALQGIQLQLTR